MCHFEVPWYPGKMSKCHIVRLIPGSILDADSLSDSAYAEIFDKLLRPNDYSVH